MRVLIVEDDRDTQEGIQYLLDSPVLETISARNGLEALDILRRSDLPIDLIVLDLMLPRLSGWELLIELARRYRSSSCQRSRRRRSTWGRRPISRSRLIRRCSSGLWSGCSESREHPPGKLR
jgi:CheY-like chemotaxis protein